MKSSLKQGRSPLAELVCAALILAVGATADAEPAPRAFLGVRMDTAPSGQVRLTAILPDSPADRAGLMRGDLVTRVGGQPVTTTDDIIEAVGSRSPGTPLQLQIQRGGQRLTMSAPLTTAPQPRQVHRAFIGHDAPAFRLPQADGADAVSLSGLNGRVVLVYFWSTWCGACRMATPNLTRLERTYGSRGLSVVAISDDPLDELRRSASSSGLTFPLLHDLGGKVATEYWVSAVPTFFLIDQQGDVVFATEGWDPTQGRAMEAEIQRRLSSASP